MTFYGLTDAAPGDAHERSGCKQCGSTVQIANGLCVNCMLHPGLEGGGSDRQTLAAVLTEIDVRDADWRIGNYQVLEEIGRGGMGVIYRARQRHSRRIVALKRVLSFHSDSRETLTRFRREAEAAASLDHPNILPIYEVGETEDSLPFFSMKFAVGGTLLQARSRLRNQPSEVVRLMVKVTRAVQYAHSQGILHRDLKPGNILLDGRGEPLVTDFGLAKWLTQASDLTRTLTIFGTPGYIAPEQSSGSATTLNPTSDIYSLGAILFDLLAGRPPFLGEHALAVIRQAAEKPAPKLRTLTASVDRDLETICARCLEREPQARYQSAGDLAEDLTRWLECRPIIARPLLPPVRIWRWSKRNPKLAGAAAVWLFSVIAAIASFFLFSHRVVPPSSAHPVREKSIAVLPFANVGNDNESAYFTEGVHDETLADLARIRGLKVISNTSVMQYQPATKRDFREIAQTLGVAYVMKGSVERTSNQVRVHVQLIDAQTGTNVWVGEYERAPDDMFTIQSELAEKIVAELKTELSPAEKIAIGRQPTVDLIAFDLYAHARVLINKSTFGEPKRENLFEAVRLLEAATKQDPSFSLAYYQLAHAHDQIYWAWFDHSEQRLALADAAIQSLRHRNPDSGEAHLALARHLYWGYLDYDRARQELSAAKNSLPNNPMVFLLAGYIDRRQGHWKESMANLKRASELDPRNPIIPSQMALSYKFLRRYSEMAAMFDRALALAPQSMRAKIGRATVDLDQRGDTRPLHLVIESLVAASPSNAAMIADDWFDLAIAERDADASARALSVMGPNGYGPEGIVFPLAWCAGRVALLRGDAAGARSEFMKARSELRKNLRDQPEDGTVSCALGLVDAALGNKKAAVQEGRRAVALMPLTKNAIDGELCIQYLAAIYAAVGDKDAAFEQLAAAAGLPGCMNYGDLRLNPFWDPLRTDPRFENIVASLNRAAIGAEKAPNH